MRLPKLLHHFHGGLKLPSFKTLSSGAAIRSAPLPGQLVVPLAQSIGAPARALVKVGDKVLKGQKIGAAAGRISSAVHASTSGVVTAVEARPIAHPSGLTALAVVIEADGEDRWIEKTPIDYQNLSPEAVRLALQEAGLVGLGGAAFPSHAKLPSAPVATLIINGAECEPYITSDDRLMRERAAEIVAGTRILKTLLAAENALIGVEDNKPEAIAALTRAVAEAGGDCQVRSIPARYPAGSFKQLIYALTGIEVSVDKLPTDFGVQCFNVATAYTVARAVLQGEPMLSRIVTVTGDVADPGNWEVPIGMPIGELLALARPNSQNGEVVVGGPMMGFLLPSACAPIVKANNCLIVRAPEPLRPDPEMPCIRCGSCARACPQELQPFELYWWSRARQFEQAERYQLANCIECGCCAYVCPAHIPLVHYFRFAKGELRARKLEQQQAEQARERFEFRQFREAREKAEKAEKLARAAAAQAAKQAASAESAPAASPSAGLSTGVNPDVIAAALSRARAQKRGEGDSASDGAEAAASAAVPCASSSHSDSEPSLS